jgi:hypothetical protein
MLHPHSKVLRDAIDVVLRNANALPPSREREELYVKLHDCMIETEAWEIFQGSSREMDTLMKRVLAAHVTMTKLAVAPEVSREVSREASREGCTQPCMAT